MDIPLPFPNRLARSDMINRTLIRLSLLVSAALAVVFLSLLFEPRRRSLNCRTFWTCISLPASYNSEIINTPITENNQEVHVTEVKLPDGTVRFTRQILGRNPTTLLLLLTRDAASWSRDFQSTRRSVYDFLDLVAKTGLPSQELALGILTASADEFDVIKTATDGVPLGKVTVFHRNDEGDTFDYAERHRHDIQDKRRATLAQLRNYLMSRALGDESHVVWMDADVVELSKRIVQTMISHAESRSDVGVITARCEQNELDNYDKNAWAIQSSSRLDETDGKEREDLEEQLTQLKTWVPDLIKGTTDTDLIALDSVGGTLLYLRAELVRRGLVFPWWPVVGTRWDKDGWLGLETEGLCYISSRMEDGGCFVLGGSHKSRHTDWG